MTDKFSKEDSRLIEERTPLFEQILPSPDQTPGDQQKEPEGDVNESQKGFLTIEFYKSENRLSRQFSDLSDLMIRRLPKR